MRLESLASQPLRAAALFGALLGLAGGTLSGLWAEPAPSAAEIDWRLPDAATLQRYRPEDFVLLQQSPAWRGLASVAAPGDTAATRAATWRLVGIVSEAGGTALVLVSGSPQLLRIVGGGSLPDGAKVIRIGGDSLVVERDGKQCTMRLFGRGGDDACATGSAPALSTAASSPPPAAPSAPPSPAGPGSLSPGNLQPAASPTTSAPPAPAPQSPAQPAPSSPTPPPAELDEISPESLLRSASPQSAPSSGNR